MVSVSRRDGWPHTGQATFRKSARLFSGLPLPSGMQSSGSTTGRSCSGTGTAPWVVAVDDGDRRAPVALAADAPVAQAPGGLFLAQRAAAVGLGRQQFGHLGHGRLAGQAVEHAAVDAAPALLVGIAVGPGVGAEGLAVDRHHLPDRQAVLLGEGEVALVMRRHAHHRAVAIAHQHIVAHPHVHRRAGQRVLHRQAGGHAFLLLRGQFGLGAAALGAFGDEGGHGRVAGARHARPAGARAPRRRRSRP